jgi:hypothetical protein
MLASVNYSNHNSILRIKVLPAKLSHSDVVTHSDARFGGEIEAVLIVVCGAYQGCVKNPCWDCWGGISPLPKIERGPRREQDDPELLPTDIVSFDVASPRVPDFDVRSINVLVDDISLPIMHRQRTTLIGFSDGFALLCRNSGLVKYLDLFDHVGNSPDLFAEQIEIKAAEQAKESECGPNSSSGLS